MMNADLPNSTMWNVDRRREFCALKPGTQLPGYRGYIEQYKYHIGDTYGNATNKLSQRDRHPIAAAWPHNYFETSTKYVGTGSAGAEVRERIPKHNLPASTGDNKLTESMVPGYTGYIPRMPFKFGGTYKEDCDVCIDDFLTNTKKHGTNVHELKQTVNGYPNLNAVTKDDDRVIKRLNDFRDRNPTAPILLESRKTPTEAPMPGYRGFIPRKGVTELGLGGRYHTVCKDSLEVFDHETQRHMAKIGKPVIPPRNEAEAVGVTGVELPRQHPDANSRRLYKQNGMVPKYTGYLPQMRYRFGNTYGDTSRSLPVCYHSRPTFGEYIRTQRSAKV
ncbi:ciliary microtubule inner protein 2B-like [Saccoglossus kowalevskii]|uniref:Protein FAM166B-like n=1 Tax=Saccoglossus kowalevskii TaxID=10224 RepID=A0ABM0GXR4_SACKO|nr:PREDICTED: protein FAM166B-like [Saccoglossus kowalevskii]